MTARHHIVRRGNRRHLDVTATTDRQFGEGQIEAALAALAEAAEQTTDKRAQGGAS